MHERSEGGGAALLVGILLILLLLLTVTGVVGYVFVARQQAMVMAERARAAEAAAMTQQAQARLSAEQARATQELASARAKELSADQGSSSGGSSQIALRAEIEALLKTQQEAWNGGDIDRFMGSYWKSDDLTFSSGGTTTRGWTATLNRYRERYPTPEKMGQLSFENLEVTPLGDAAALVLGQWQVEREPEPISGNFSLVIRRFADGWRIAHDHTSRAE